MNEILELMRRVYDHGVKAREGENKKVILDGIKENMILMFLVSIQENDNSFCIPPEIGTPFEN